MIDRDLVAYVTLQANCGAEINKLAHQAYELQKKLGVPVRFSHNNRTYKVRLEYEVTPEPTA